MSQVIKKGTLVGQVFPERFIGEVSEFRVDGENGDVLYKVTRQVFNADGTPKMAEDHRGDAEIELDAEGNEVIDPLTKRPKETGVMINIKTEQVCVYEERFFKREELEVVTPAE